MLENDLNQVKQFESLIKSYLIKEFGEYIPNDRVTLLYGRNYADDIKSNNEEQIKGELTRKMLDDLINISCYKEIRVSDELVIPLPYGVSLEDAVINYFANKLSDKYGFSIDQIPGLQEDMEIVAELDKKLEGNLEKRIFNEDAISLLKGTAFNYIVQKYDEAALADYLINMDSLSNDKLDQDKTNELLDDNMKIENIDGKQYVEYTDQNNQVQLTEITNDQELQNDIKESIEQSQDGTIDSKELNDKITENKETNYMSVNMLDFVKEHGRISEMETVKPEVEAKPETQPILEKPSRKLTLEEYEELCQRFANNEELTLDELKLLRNTNVNDLEESGPILKPKDYSGYANPSFAFYLALLFAVLCISLSIYIFFN